MFTIKNGARCVLIYDTTGSKPHVALIMEQNEETINFDEEDVDMVIQDWERLMRVFPSYSWKFKRRRPCLINEVLNSNKMTKKSFLDCSIPHIKVMLEWVILAPSKANSHEVLGHARHSDSQQENQ